MHQVGYYPEEEEKTTSLKKVEAEQAVRSKPYNPTADDDDDDNNGK